MKKLLLAVVVGFSVVACSKQDPTPKIRFSSSSLDETYTAYVTQVQRVAGGIVVVNVQLSPRKDNRWSQNFPAIGFNLKEGDYVLCHEGYISNGVGPGDLARVCESWRELKPGEGLP